MNIGPISSVSFNAKIFPNRALATALEHAQMDAWSGTNDGLKRASELYNNLRAIESDTKSNVFHIDTHSAQFYPHIRLDEHIKLLGPLGATGETVAKAVIEGINKLVNETHLKDLVKDEAKNTDLTKAFNKWL